MTSHERGELAGVAESLTRRMHVLRPVRVVLNLPRVLLQVIQV